MKSLEQRHEVVAPLLGAYALDAVEGEERREIERHLRECRICAGEVAQHHEVAAVMSSDDVAPPEGLWDRVADQLKEAPPPMRLVPVAKADRGFASSNAAKFLSAVVATAAAVTAVVGVSVFRESERLGDFEERLAGGSVEQAAIAADVDPTNRHVALVSDDGRYYVNAVMDKDSQGFVVDGQLPELSDDKTYQLWALGDNHTVSLGIIGKDLKPAAFVMPAGAHTIAVTEEAAVGAISPSGTPIVHSRTLAS